MQAASARGRAAAAAPALKPTTTGTPHEPRQVVPLRPAPRRAADDAQHLRLGPPALGVLQHHLLERPHREAVDRAAHRGRERHDRERPPLQDAERHRDHHDVGRQHPAGAQADREPAPVTGSHGPHRRPQAHVEALRQLLGHHRVAAPHERIAADLLVALVQGARPEPCRIEAVLLRQRGLHRPAVDRRRAHARGAEDVLRRVDDGVGARGHALHRAAHACLGGIDARRLGPREAVDDLVVVVRGHQRRAPAAHEPRDRVAAHPVDPRRAELDRHAPRAVGADAPADPVAGLEDRHDRAGAPQGIRGGEAGDAGADHDHRVALDAAAAIQEPRRGMAAGQVGALHGRGMRRAGVLPREHEAVADHRVRDRLPHVGRRPDRQRRVGAERPGIGIPAGDQPARRGARGARARTGRQRTRAEHGRGHGRPQEAPPADAHAHAPRMPAQVAAVGAPGFEPGPYRL